MVACGLSQSSCSTGLDPGVCVKRTSDARTHSSAVWQTYGGGSVRGGDNIRLDWIGLSNGFVLNMYVHLTCVARLEGASGVWICVDWIGLVVQ